MNTTETPASETPCLYPYTVLLLRPDYIASEYGKDTYLAHVMAADRDHAVAVAQASAFDADDGEPAEKDVVAPDYYPLLTLAGHHSEATAAPIPGLTQVELVAVLTNAADLLDDAIDTHIYSDDDPPPGDDCPYKLTVEELRATAQRLAAAPDPVSALIGVIPYAESRCEDLEASKAAGNEDPDFPGAAEAWEALQIAKRTLAAHQGSNHDAT